MWPSSQRCLFLNEDPPSEAHKGGSVSWLPLSSGSSTEKIIGDIKMPFGLAESFVRMAWASFHLTQVHTSQLPGEYNQLLLSSQCRLPLNLVSGSIF